MAIQCQKCLYILSKSEAFGYMTSEVYKLCKNVLMPCLTEHCAKRGIQNYLNDITESIIIGILNDSKTECHVCMKYLGWSQNVSLTNIISQANQKEVI
jgi:hypothetical protein